MADPSGAPGPDPSSELLSLLAVWRRRLDELHLDAVATADDDADGDQIYNACATELELCIRETEAVVAGLEGKSSSGGASPAERDSERCFAWIDEARFALMDVRRLARRLDRLGMSATSNSMRAVSGLLVMRIAEWSHAS